MNEQNLLSDIPFVARGVEFDEKNPDKESIIAQISNIVEKTNELRMIKLPEFPVTKVPFDDNILTNGSLIKDII